MAWPERKHSLLSGFSATEDEVLHGRFEVGTILRRRRLRHGRNHIAGYAEIMQGLNAIPHINHSAMPWGVWKISADVKQLHIVEPHTERFRSAGVRCRRSCW